MILMVFAVARANIDSSATAQADAQSQSGSQRERWVTITLRLYGRFDFEEGDGLFKPPEYEKSKFTTCLALSDKLMTPSVEFVSKKKVDDPFFFNLSQTLGTAVYLAPPSEHPGADWLRAATSNTSPEEIKSEEGYKCKDPFLKAGNNPGWVDMSITLRTAPAHEERWLILSLMSKICDAMSKSDCPPKLFAEHYTSDPAIEYSKRNDPRSYPPFIGLTVLSQAGGPTRSLIKFTEKQGADEKAVTIKEAERLDFVSTAADSSKSYTSRDGFRFSEDDKETARLCIDLSKVWNVTGKLDTDDLETAVKAYVIKEK